MRSPVVEAGQRVAVVDGQQAARVASAAAAPPASAGRRDGISTRCPGGKQSAFRRDAAAPGIGARSRPNSTGCSASSGHATRTSRQAAAASRRAPVARTGTHPRIRWKRSARGPRRRRARRRSPVPRTFRRPREPLPLLRGAQPVGNFHEMIMQPTPRPPAERTPDFRREFAAAAAEFDQVPASPARHLPAMRARPTPRPPVPTRGAAWPTWKNPLPGPRCAPAGNNNRGAGGTAPPA